MVVEELTPATLMAQLVIVHGVKSEDDLAGKTPNSLRTLRRWKKDGWPKNVEHALGLLREAGLLAPAVATGEGEEPTGLLLAQLAATIQTLAAAHRAALGDLDAVSVRLERLEEELSRAPVRRKRRQG